MGMGCKYSLPFMDNKSDTLTRDLAKLFGLSKSNSLTLSRSHVETNDGIEYQAKWIDERNENQKLIARYRSWTNQSHRPPYHKQIGWERYSVTGQLLDREVRYSKRDTNEWVH